MMIVSMILMRNDYRLLCHLGLALSNSYHSPLHHLTITGQRYIQQLTYKSLKLNTPILWIFHLLMIILPALGDDVESLHSKEDAPNEKEDRSNTRARRIYE